MEVPTSSCGICGESGAKLLSNLQTLRTKYSGSSVYELLERFVKCELLELASIMPDCAACNECYTKLNDYDAAYTKALIIQKELLDLMKQSPLGLVVHLEMRLNCKHEEEHDQDCEPQEADEQSQEAAEITYLPDVQHVAVPAKSSLCNEVSWKCNTCGARFKNLSEMQTHKHGRYKTDSNDEEWIVSDLDIEPLQPVPHTLQDEEEDISQHSVDMVVDEPAGSVDSDDLIVEELEWEEDESVAEPPVSTKQANECYYCDEYFPFKETFKKHLARVHSSEYGRHQCKTCGFTAKTRAALCNHFARHSRPAISCHICHREFQQSGTLQRHLAIHSRTASYHCKLCGKSYVHYSSFYMHQLAHKDIRMQKCKICGFELRSTSHLQRHMRTHSGEKPFECPECGKRFSQRYNMRTHLNSHKGITRKSIKTFGCMLCQKVCPRKMKLRQHLQVDHGLSDETEIEQAMMIQIN